MAYIEQQAQSTSFKIEGLCAYQAEKEEGIFIFFRPEIRDGEGWQDNLRSFNSGSPDRWDLVVQS